MTPGRKRGGVVGWGVVAVLGLAVLGGAPSAMGQFQPPSQQPTRPVAPRPPRPQKADDPPVLWMVALMVLLAGGICGAALIPSKRGHQD